MIEDERTNDKDVLNKVSEKPKEFSLKRKSPSPLPTEPPNKILVVSEPSNHILRTTENKQAPQVLQVTKRQNFALITVTGNEISGWYFSFCYFYVNSLGINLIPLCVLDVIESKLFNIKDYFIIKISTLRNTMIKKKIYLKIIAFKL